MAVGAAWALAGCAADKPFTVIGVIARQQNVSLTEVKATFVPMGVLFYGIAVHQGDRFSFRQVTPAELTKIG